ncbi:hypothetical protein ACHAXA_009731 [Cyclostephanos tholiformis]|uniref:Large ribosomal subunit protein mL49 n=1 Tax=Cyclostephanos tholiformis TaxID=382380 RepID=A0ABD3R912_9STRA
MSLLCPLPTLLRTVRPPRPPYLSNATSRSKHSATQVKRLFKNNPARLRLLKKEGRSPNEPRNIPEHPTFPPVFKPTFLGNGWSAPPNPSEVEIPEYPFRVTRTGNKPFGAVGFLPVYRDVRIHGTKHTTIIRNVAGDIPSFINELRAVLRLPLGKRGILTSASTGKHGGGEAGRGVNAENPIRIRSGGAIEVNGDHAREVKRWLAGLGF